MKTCSRCSAAQPLTEFKANPTCRDGRSPWCRRCFRDYRRRLYLRDAEKERAASKQWRTDHREAHLAACRAWGRANPEMRRTINQRYVAKHPEQVRARKRRWYERNRAHVYAKVARRKAAVKRATVEPVSLDAVFIRDRGRCHLCRVRVVRADASLDHLVPISRGGEHSMRNVALAHRRCNTQRGPRSL